jgi:uncharacterized membrane protein YdbT with pleckstrin-like domain
MSHPMLTEGERIEFEFRPHWRALIVPALLLIVLAFAGTWLFFRLAQSSGILGWTLWRWILIGFAVVVLIGWVIAPFMRWITTHYIFTNRRVIVRVGSLRRQGRDMPLTKITDVTFDESIPGRMMNYGTLHIASASDDGQLDIADVPNIQTVQRDLFALVEQVRGGA